MFIGFNKVFVGFNKVFSFFGCVQLVCCRYFFKTACEELGDQVIQEEICNDADVLPLCEGKIMAQVKAIE